MSESKSPSACDDNKSDRVCNGSDTFRLLLGTQLGLGLKTSSIKTKDTFFFLPFCRLARCVYRLTNWIREIEKITSEDFYYKNMWNSECLKRFLSLSGLFLSAYESEIILHRWTLIKKRLPPFFYYKSNSFYLSWYKRRETTFGLFSLDIEILRTSWNLKLFNSNNKKKVFVQLCISEKIDDIVYV